jgi:phage recombination protein Bet
MSGSTSALAVRDSRAPASMPAGALAISEGQTAWTPMQAAALTQLGISGASDGDKAVFLHQCQRTGLDPFAKQIYMIGRNEKKSEKRGTQWVDVWSVKWTIQTGIEGWRVIRDRAERREGVRGILSRFTYYDHDDNERKVWTQPRPPAAIEVTYSVVEAGGREVPYTSVLRFDEYVQTKEDKNGQRYAIAQWAVKPVHMLEKCTEADVYRKAFPQDYAGVYLDDAMPLPDDDAPPAPQVRQQVTAEQARARAPQHVTAAVVTPEASSPAETAPVLPRSGQRSAGEDPTTEAGSSSAAAAPSRPKSAASSKSSPASSAASPNEPAKSPAEIITGHLERLGADISREARLRLTGRLAGHGVTTTGDLTPAETAAVIRKLNDCDTPEDLDGLLADLALADDPRSDGE